MTRQDRKTILREFNMSKNAFKRAVGRLLKERKSREFTRKDHRKGIKTFAGADPAVSYGQQKDSCVYYSCLFILN